MSGSQIFLQAQVNSCLHLVEKREAFRRKINKDYFAKNSIRLRGLKQHWDGIHLDRYNIKAREGASFIYLLRDRVQLWSCSGSRAISKALHLENSGTSAVMGATEGAGPRRRGNYSQQTWQYPGKRTAGQE